MDATAEWKVAASIYRTNAFNDKNSGKKFYFALADKPFKERYRNRKRDFKYE